MTALEMFRLIAKEFATVSDADVSKWIEVAGQRISESKFGNLYLQALAYLTAHMMKLDKIAQSSAAAGLSGIAKREKTGDLEVEYLTQFNLDKTGSYYLTMYGQQFLLIQRQRIIPVMNRM